MPKPKNVTFTVFLCLLFILSGPSEINNLNDTSTLEDPLSPAWDSRVLDYNSIARKDSRNSISILKALKNPRRSQVKDWGIEYSVMTVRRVVQLPTTSVGS
jgi:hypothetical protein